MFVLSKPFDVILQLTGSIRKFKNKIKRYFLVLDQNS